MGCGVGSLSGSTFRGNLRESLRAAAMDASSRLNGDAGPPLASRDFSSKSRGGDSEDMVLMMERQMELELALRSKEQSIRELQHMVDSLGESVQKHKKEAEEVRPSACSLFCTFLLMPRNRGADIADSSIACAPLRQQRFCPACHGLTPSAAADCWPPQLIALCLCLRCVQQAMANKLLTLELNECQSGLVSHLLWRMLLPQKKGRLKKSDWVDRHFATGPPPASSFLSKHAANGITKRPQGHTFHMFLTEGRLESGLSWAPRCQLLCCCPEHAGCWQWSSQGCSPVPHGLCGRRVQCSGAPQQAARGGRQGQGRGACQVLRKLL